MNTKVDPRAAAAGATLLLLLSWPALAQTPRVDRVEIVDKGFYVAQRTGKTTDAPGSVLGRDNIVTKVRFLRRTPQDSARVGVSFGVRFRTIGHPQNARVGLRSVWKIPAPGIKNPKSGNVYRQSVVNFTTTMGTAHLRGYSFEQPWEVVPGVWTLQIWQGDRKLLERSFTIQ